MREERFGVVRWARGLDWHVLKEDADWTPSPDACGYPLNAIRLRSIHDADLLIKAWESGAAWADLPVRRVVVDGVRMSLFEIDA